MLRITDSGCDGDCPVSAKVSRPVSAVPVVAVRACGAVETKRERPAPCPAVERSRRDQRSRLCGGPRSDRAASAGSSNTSHSVSAALKQRGGTGRGKRERQPQGVAVALRRDRRTPDRRHRLPRGDAGGGGAAAARAAALGRRHRGVAGGRGGAGVVFGQIGFDRGAGASDRRFRGGDPADGGGRRGAIRRCSGWISMWACRAIFGRFDGGGMPGGAAGAARCAGASPAHWFAWPAPPAAECRHRRCSSSPRGRHRTSASPISDELDRRGSSARSSVRSTRRSAQRRSWHRPDRRRARRRTSATVCPCQRSVETLTPSGSSKM